MRRPVLPVPPRMRMFFMPPRELHGLEDDPWENIADAFVIV
jgi:hypothetical protein